MNRLERNRRYMLMAVIRVCDTHREKWESYSDFSGPMARLVEFGDEYELLRKEKQELQVPLSDVRDGEWELLADVFLQLSALLLAKAQELENADAVKFLSINRSSLLRGSFEFTLTLAGRILDHAQELNAADDSELMVETLEQASALYAKFANTGMRPLERRVRSGQVTQLLAKLYQDMMYFFKMELDPLMRVFKFKDPEFYAAYNRARVIPKLAGQDAPGSGSNEDGGARGSANSEGSFQAIDSGASGSSGSGEDPPIGGAEEDAAAA